MNILLQKLDSNNIEINVPEQKLLLSTEFFIPNILSVFLTVGKQNFAPNIQRDFIFNLLFVKKIERIINYHIQKSEIYILEKVGRRQAHLNQVDSTKRNNYLLHKVRRNLYE